MTNQEIESKDWAGARVRTSLTRIWNDGYVPVDVPGSGKILNRSCAVPGAWSIQNDDGTVAWYHPEEMEWESNPDPKDPLEERAMQHLIVREERHERSQSERARLQTGQPAPACGGSLDVST